MKMYTISYENYPLKITLELEADTIRDAYSKWCSKIKQPMHEYDLDLQPDDVLYEWAKVKKQIHPTTQEVSYLVTTFTDWRCGLLFKATQLHSTFPSNIENLVDDDEIENFYNNYRSEV